MLRYAHTISSASRRLASRHPMFCDPCTAGPRQFYPLRNNNFHMTSESKRITVNGNQHNIKIDKIGNLLCVCNITLNTVTFNGSAFDVYTDPFDVSCRPKSTCVSPLSINGGEAMMEVMMLPDGRINLWNPNYKGNATMPMRGTLIWTV